jgi:glutathione S-transferase
MTDLTFWTNPQSRGAIVRWMLEEVGAPYETVVLNYGDDMRAPAYLAINPMGKVPAIRHHGQVVTEAAGLAPAPDDRAAYYRWMFFGAGPAEAAVTNRTMGFVAPPERRRMLGYGDYDSVIEALVGRLEQSPYLAGDRFSAVDVYAGSQIGWGVQFGTMPDLPAFRAYWARVTDRPAFARATALDAALMGAPA